MVKATFDIRSIELPPVAVKPLYAGVGASDIAYTAVKEYVSDVQKKINDVQKQVRDFDPKSLRKQATEAAESRVAELQAVPTRVQSRVQNAVESNVSTVVETYGDLAKRGETLVTRFRSGQPTVDLEVKSTQTKVVSVKASAGTTTAPAKKATPAKKTTAKKTTAKKAPAKKAPAKKATTVKQTTVKTGPESPVKATITTESSN